jgi:DME family drug/metabolite transporter
MVAAAVLWGTIGPSVEQLGRHGALTFVDISFWRAIIASVALAAFALLVVRGTRRPRGRDLTAGLLCGASTAASQLCYFAALAELGIAPATLIALGLGPLLVAIAEATFLGRRPSRRLLAVIAASLSGMALLVLGAGTTAPEDGDVALGVVLASGSAATYAAVVLASGRASHALGPVGLNLLVFVGVALSLAPVVAVAGLGTPSDGEEIALTLYLGLFASALAYGLYFLAARTLRSTVISVFALLEPLTAAILAWIVFGQALSAVGILGGALLLGGVVALGGEDDLVAESAIAAAIPETADPRSAGY